MNDGTSALRAPFPYLDERIYLDTAAAGLSWQGHGAAVARFHDTVKNRGYDAATEWRAMTARVRSRLADRLGVHPAGLTFVTNTTEGLNLAAHSLRFAPGDRIVFADDEFPSVAGVWEPARRAGATLVPVPIPSETDREAALLAAIEHGARLLAVSHVHWSTGTRVDLVRLGAACRARGALLLVDGIQGLGAIPVDLSAVDLYATSFFKWMLSGFGIGILVASPRARALLTPAWRGYVNLDATDVLQYAHVNIPGIYGLDATLDFFDAVGWTRIHQRVHRLGGHLLSRVRALGLDCRTPDSAHAGVFALACDDPETVRASLADRGISVSARGAGIRISPHYYNTEAEIDRCLEAFADIARPGLRTPPLPLPR